MSNQRKIPPENLQGHRDVVVLATTSDGSAGSDAPKRFVPELPFPTLARTRDAYARFWTTEAGLHVKPEDWTELFTAFENYDMYLRLLSDFRKTRWERGSMGQRVMNPAGREAQSWLRLALVIFFRYGFDPRGRLQLGIGTTNLGRPGPGGPRSLNDDDVEDPDETESEEPALIKPRAQRG